MCKRLTFRRSRYLVGVEDTLPVGSKHFPNAVTSVFDGVRRSRPIDTVDHNDGYIGTGTEAVMTRRPNRTALYVGGNAAIGAGMRTEATTTTKASDRTSQPISFDINGDGQVENIVRGAIARSQSTTVDTAEESTFAFTPVRAELVLGAVINLNSDEAWTKAMSAIAIESYAGTEQSGVRGSIRGSLRNGLSLAGSVDQGIRRSAEIAASLDWTF